MWEGKQGSEGKRWSLEEGESQAKKLNHLMLPYLALPVAGCDCFLLPWCLKSTSTTDRDVCLYVIPIYLLLNFTLYSLTNDS